MASGRHVKLVGQAGEYLVASELARRGLIATTFTGNLPHYDIIASNEAGKHVSVQVKTVTGSSWQTADVRKFMEIRLEEPKQIVGDIMPSPVENLVFVFVILKTYGDDRFFICTWEEICGALREHHASYLEKHGGARPKKWNSFHAALPFKDLSRFENRWELIDDVLAK